MMFSGKGKAHFKGQRNLKVLLVLLSDVRRCVSLVPFFLSSVHPSVFLWIESLCYSYTVRRLLHCLHSFKVEVSFSPVKYLPCATNSRPPSLGLSSVHFFYHHFYFEVKGLKSLF